MDRNDYIGLLDRALASVNGIRLDYEDDTTARRVRAKLYHVRDELRAEANTEPATTPAVTYDASGKLLGVIDILRQRTPVPTRYDCLRMRVWHGSLYIVRFADRPRRVDDVASARECDIDDRDLAALPHWPPWGERSR